MKPLCVLITNHSLSDAGGTELYVFDLALKLLELGHRPVVYSTRLGPFASRLLHATVPVVDRLDQLGVIPDIIHGHHSLATATALLSFSRVPAVYVCHDCTWHHDTPPAMKRIRRLIAVDQSVADRVICRDGHPEGQLEVLTNGVDLKRFCLRPEPLPVAIRKALIFSNYMSDRDIGPIATACAEHGIELDLAGKVSGSPAAQPERLLPLYDLVFAKGRCAWEALATGAAVVVCDQKGIGGMVRMDNLARMAPRNFGRRLLGRPLDSGILSSEIGKFDPADAGKVSARVREISNLDDKVERLVSIYRTVIEEHRGESTNSSAEMQDAARLLAWCDRSVSLWNTEFEAGARPNLDFEARPVLRIHDSAQGGERRKAG